MRRAVFKANMLHNALSNVFFGDFLVAKRADRATVMSGGAHAGTQGFSRVDDKEAKVTINFNDIDNFNNVWNWIEGPFRDAIVGCEMALQAKLLPLRCFGHQKLKWVVLFYVTIPSLAVPAYIKYVLELQVVTNHLNWMFFKRIA